MAPEHPPQRNGTDPVPVRQFRCHVCAVCAIALLTLALGETDPGNPAPLALLPVAAMARWIETFDETDWSMSVIVIDIALGLMTADIIAFWT